MSERSDFDDAVLDDCRRVDADHARGRRDRMARLFSRDEPFSEPDDDTDARNESEDDA